jgi:hypothetical protein
VSIWPGSFVKKLVSLVKAGLALVLCLGTAGVSLVLVGVDPAGATVPSITSIAPTSGLPGGGTVVTIHGSALKVSVTPTVMFGTHAGTVTASSVSLITVTSPAGTGAVNVTVTTSGGTGTAPSQFFYENAPTVTALYGSGSPIAGGQTMLIEGTNLCGATSIQVTTPTPVQFATWTNPGGNCNLIQAVAPALPANDHKSGSNLAGQFFNITVTTGSGTSATGLANQFYWFGAGSCTYTGTGLVNGSTGPPGTSGYLLNAQPGIQGTTGTIAAGGTTLTDPNAHFTPSAVGEGIWVIGAGASGASLDTTIASYVSATRITLATAASTAVTGNATYGYGFTLGTNCTGLDSDQIPAGLALNSPFIESLSDP